MRNAIGSLAVRHRTEWIMLSAVLGLVAFYYLTRADTIGVSSPARGWTAMTGASVAAWRHFVSAAVLLGLVPVSMAWLAGRSPRSVGLGLGRWREGLLWLAAGVPLAVVAGRIAAANPLMRAVYPLYPQHLDGTGLFAAYAALQILYFGAWEVLFRGVLLFGTEDIVGPRPANLFQTALSVTAHFGRALTETFSALPAGLVFGAVALRTRSVWYTAIIHWTVAVSMDWFIMHGVCS
ncbi:MAG: CPBP family intramembrane metalloprotease [Gemmatimonadota bacterium]|jgi:membrane protease YdiL (CAAX protease family)